MENPLPIRKPGDSGISPFWWVFGATLVLKSILAAMLPLTGDEAYFALWGLHPDFGYYDHPPMIGWWLWPLLELGHGPFVIRLPAILVPLAVAVVLRSVLRKLDPERAEVVGVLFLLSPLNLLIVLSTTDTPLVFFSTLSVFFAYRNFTSGRWWNAWLCGLFLGAAFLSKYFAVLLGVAYLVIFLGMRPARKGWPALLWVVFGALPGIAVNVVWNYQNGWTNILFNVFNRNEAAGFSWTNPLFFLALTLVWLGPGIVYVAFRTRKQLIARLRDRYSEMMRDGTVVFLVACVVPGGMFFLVSLFKEIGFHWLMSFYPFAFVVLFVLFDAGELRRMIRPMAWYGLVPAALVLALLMVPVDWLRSIKDYDSFLFAARPGRVVAALEPLRGDYILAARSYAKAAQLELLTGSHVPVLGTGSHNGRHDDMLTDFRILKGRNFAILTLNRERAAQASAWFDESEVVPLGLPGTKFAVLLGRGFNYDTYRREVLQVVADRYYRVPKLLEPVMGPSRFLDRYRFDRVAAEP